MQVLLFELVWALFKSTIQMPVILWVFVTSFKHTFLVGFQSCHPYRSCGMDKLPQLPLFTQGFNHSVQSWHTSHPRTEWWWGKRTLPQAARDQDSGDNSIRGRNKETSHLMMKESTTLLKGICFVCVFSSFLWMQTGYWTAAGLLDLGNRHQQTEWILTRLKAHLHNKDLRLEDVHDRHFMLQVNHNNNNNIIILAIKH